MILDPLRWDSRATTEVLAKGSFADIIQFFFFEKLIVQERCRLKLMNLKILNTSSIIRQCSVKFNSISI